MFLKVNRMHACNDLDMAEDQEKIFQMPSLDSTTRTFSINSTLCTLKPYYMCSEWSLEWAEYIINVWFTKLRGNI